MHVQLPEEMPDTGAEGWAMSPYAVLVQVKGGAYVNSGVRLQVDRWAYLLASMTPVYVAAVPEADLPWIASVDRLLPRGVADIETQSYEARPTSPLWDPRAFLSEAQLGAKLGSPRLRRWWRGLQPYLDDDDPFDRAHELLLYLLDLAVLSVITGPTMDVQQFYESADKVRTMVATHHPLVAALSELELAYETETSGLELGVDLAVSVPEREFVEPSGKVTSEGVAGRNNLVTVSEEMSLIQLATPTIDLFLASLNEEHG